MSDFRSMDSDVLEARMRVLLGRGRQAEVDFLLHLMEFDRRRGYEALGYVRLWDYCRKELHFLEGASWRRMHAIAILRRFPAAEGYLRDGRLSMTALVLLEDALTSENAVEMFEKATHRSKKEIEYLVACVRAPVTLGKASIRKKVAPLNRAGRGTPLTEFADGDVVAPCAIDSAAVPVAVSATLDAAVVSATAVPAIAGSGSDGAASGATRGVVGVVERNVERNDERTIDRTLETTVGGSDEGTAGGWVAGTGGGSDEGTIRDTIGDKIGGTVGGTIGGTVGGTGEAGKKVRPSRTGSVEALSGDCFQVRMTVTKEFVDALEKVQKILGHTISRTDIAGALKAGLDVILARDAKKKTPQPRRLHAKKAQPRKAEPTATPPKTGSAMTPRPTEPGRSDDTRPTDARPTETLRTDVRPTETLRTDVRPTETLRTDVRPTETLRTDARPTTTPAMKSQPTKAESVKRRPTDTQPTAESTDMPRMKARPTEPAGSEEARASRLEGARDRAELDERIFFPAWGVARREHIPVEVSRAVWARDGGCCVWVMASGERCGSDEEAQIDHEIPVAFGGRPTVGNLRIYCRGHNLLHARRSFGDAFMGRFCGVAPERLPARSAE